MQSVFDYNDYRQFLSDHYHFKKQQNSSFSFRFFARKANLSSPNYYKLVMDGKRNLTHKNIKNFCKGLNLNEKESLYFENLVFFNQSKDPDEAKFYENNLALVRTHVFKTLMNKDQYEVLSKWYPLAIKELLLIEGLSHQPKELAKRLGFDITPVEAREALELLEKLKLIEKKGAHRYASTQQNLQTPNEVLSQAAQFWHEQMIEKSKTALKKQGAQTRCFTGLTVAIHKSHLAKAFEKIHEFRNELDQLFSKSKSFDAVYQLNIALFRLDDHD